LELDIENIYMMLDLRTLNFGSKALALPRYSIVNHYHKISNFGRWKSFSAM